jgi:hypothetical protein
VTRRWRESSHFHRVAERARSTPIDDSGKSYLVA